MNWRTGIVVEWRAHDDWGSCSTIKRMAITMTRGGDRSNENEWRSTVLLLAGSSQCISMNDYFSNLAFWWIARPARYSSAQIEFRWFWFWWMNEKRIRLTWPLTIVLSYKFYRSSISQNVHSLRLWVAQIPPTLVPVPMYEYGHWSKYHPQKGGICW